MSGNPTGIHSAHYVLTSSKWPKLLLLNVIIIMLLLLKVLLMAMYRYYSG